MHGLFPGISEFLLMWLIYCYLWLFLVNCIFSSQYFALIATLPSEIYIYIVHKLTIKSNLFCCGCVNVKRTQSCNLDFSRGATDSKPDMNSQSSFTSYQSYIAQPKSWLFNSLKKVFCGFEPLNFPAYGCELN